MTSKEKEILPRRCEDCLEKKEAEVCGFTADAYCYNCDYAMDRFEPDEI